MCVCASARASMRCYNIHEDQLMRKAGRLHWKSRWTYRRIVLQCTAACKAYKLPCCPAKLNTRNCTSSQHAPPSTTPVACDRALRVQTRTLPCLLLDHSAPGSLCTRSELSIHRLCFQEGVSKTFCQTS